MASDPLPSMNAINLDMRPGSASGKMHFQPATVSAVTIRNFHVAAFSTSKMCSQFGNGCKCIPDCGKSLPLPHGIPNILAGGPEFTSNNITSLSLENCSIGGVDMKNLLGGGGYFNVTWPFIASGGLKVDGTPIVPSPPLYYA